MKHLIVSLTVIALVIVSFGVSSAEEPAKIVTVSRTGHGSTIFSIDAEGNWAKSRESGRVIWKEKVAPEKMAELKKAIDSLKWDDVKPEYKAVEENKTPYTVVVVVSGKSYTTVVEYPGMLMKLSENKTAPEALRKIIRLVAYYSPAQPLPGPKVELVD